MTDRQHPDLPAQQPPQAPPTHRPDLQPGAWDGRYHYPDYAVASESDGADWRRMLDLLWQRKLWILAALVLGIAGGYLATRFVSPSYQTTASVWIQQQNDRQSGPVRTGDVLQGHGWASIFTSRPVLAPVVRDYKLHVTLLEPDRLRGDGVLDTFELQEGFVMGTYTLEVTGDTWTLSRDGDGVLSSGDVGEAIGAEAGFRWDPPASVLTPETEIRIRATTPQQAAFGLNRAIDVRYSPKDSPILSATLTWPRPDEGAAILNSVSQNFVQIAKELQRAKVQEEVAMLREQVDYAEDRLQSAEYSLQNQRVETVTQPREGMISPVPPPTSGQGAGGQASVGAGYGDPTFGSYFQKKLTADQLESDIGQLEEIRAGIRQGGEPNLLALNMIPSVTNAPELQAAVQELQQKEVERRSMLYEYTPEHPQVDSIADQIRTLQSQTIPMHIDRLTSNLENQLQVVNNRLEAQGEELREIPRASIEEARRTRQVNMASNLYQMLTSRLKEAELAEATSGPQIEILETALPPNSPSSNEAPRLFAIFAMAGLGLGIGGVLLHDRLDTRIRHPDQVTQTLGLPVLGVVPQLGSGRRKHLNETNAAIAIESFRSLRTQIAHSNGHSHGVTLVTSPAPREGKSMVSANLAISYASAGYRTILVDTDTRRGRAQEMFGLSRSPGLMDYLVGREELDGVLQETEVDGLDLIARGSSEGFNADLLEAERMDDLLATLRERYEAIVLDSPPLAAGADVLMLGERADKVIVVVRAGDTSEDLARTKLEMLGNVDLPIVGAVLNAMPKSAPYYDKYVNYYYADAELAS